MHLYIGQAFIIRNEFAICHFPSCGNKANPLSNEKWQMVNSIVYMLRNLTPD
jgi:hypothetical protein